MKTGASGFYPSSSDPNELRRAVTEQARAQERTVLTFQQHMALMTKLENNLIAMSETVAKMTTKITRLETKMAVYAGLGATVGGGLTAALSKLLGP